MGIGTSFIFDWQIRNEVSKDSFIKKKKKEDKMS